MLRLLELGTAEELLGVEGQYVTPGGDEVQLGGTP
jgi:hypothetical protein